LTCYIVKPLVRTGTLKEKKERLRRGDERMDFRQAQARPLDDATNPIPRSRPRPAAHFPASLRTAREGTLSLESGWGLAISDDDVNVGHRGHRHRRWRACVDMRNQLHCNACAGETALLGKIVIIV
jgi:hypothetical protein